MKRPIVLIFGLFSTSFACAASANEVAFVCDYQLGAETGAKREKIGSVAIAIDVKNKTARIDFGKGWFKTNTLQVNGNNLKETAPSTSGKKLGFFYFDLRANRGGYSGDGFDEFFSACNQDNTVLSAANMPPKDEPPTVTADRKKQATAPPTASEKTVPSRSSGNAVTEYHGSTEPQTKPARTAEAANPPDETKATRSAEAPAAVTPPAPPQTGGKATTEYFGGTASRANPAWAAEATMDPTYGTKLTRSTATPAAVNEPPPAPTGGKAITEFFGDATSQTSPAWAAGATMNREYDKTKLSTVGASTDSPAASPAREASIDSCEGALSASARAANLYFANASFDIDPRGKADLEKIAKAITDCGNVAVEVGGYTDNWGNPDSNKKLSLLRANAVVDFLVGKGVDSLKLKAVGYGQDQPIATNRTLAGRRSNRRVEFHISALKAETP